MDSDLDIDELSEFHRIVMDNSAMWLNVLDKDARGLCGTGRRRRSAATAGRRCLAVTISGSCSTR